MTRNPFGPLVLMAETRPAMTLAVCIAMLVAMFLTGMAWEMAVNALPLFDGENQ